MDNRNNLLIFILTLGVFGILNTELGVVGILPLIAEHFHVSISKAGSLVSLFALGVAISGPILPLLFSGMNRKKVMLIVLGVFVLGNIVSIFASNFTVLLIARVIPAFLHPVYISIALTVASTSVSKDEVRKAVSKVVLGVSAGMVLGVPLATFIASETSLKMAMLFFAIVNVTVLIVTLLFVPSMPVTEKRSYSSQLSILKKSMTWLSILAVVFLNAARNGVYSYFADYLQTVTHVSAKILTVMLVLFGAATIFGNIMAGKMLARNAMKTVVSYPFAFGAVYLLLFFMGKFTGPMFLIVLLWGILFALGTNISQYWISSTAPAAPEFANGLFLSFGNLGITIGTSVGELFISGLGTQYVVFSGLLFLILGLIFILLRNYMYSPKNQTGHNF